MPSKTHIESLTELAASGEPFVSVTVIDTTGSVPSEPGAKMLVTSRGLHHGTVGGGEIEQAALERAGGMLEVAESKTEFLTWNLDRDLGMTCAGVVKLFFEIYNVALWNIVIFGAGHVANALVGTLGNLDCRLTVIDPREEWLARLPASERLRTIHAADMTTEVASLPNDAFVLLMTMGHDTDRDVLVEILRSRTFPYLGVIGSSTKAKRLASQIADAGIPEERRGGYRCPIGLKLGSNHPSEIAISVAAELIQERDRWTKGG